MATLQGLLGGNRGAWNTGQWAGMPQGMNAPGAVQAALSSGAQLPRYGMGRAVNRPAWEALGINPNQLSGADAAALQKARGQQALAAMPQGLDFMQQQAYLAANQLPWNAAGNTAAQINYAEQGNMGARWDNATGQMVSTTGQPYMPNAGNGGGPIIDPGGAPTPGSAAGWATMPAGPALGSAAYQAANPSTGMRIGYTGNPALDYAPWPTSGSGSGSGSGTGVGAAQTAQDAAQAQQQQLAGGANNPNTGGLPQAIGGVAGALGQLQGGGGTPVDGTGGLGGWGSGDPALQGGGMLGSIMGGGAGIGGGAGGAPGGWTIGPDGSMQPNPGQQASMNPYAVQNYLDPSMAFQMQQGLRGLGSSASAGGQTYSGNTLKDILGYSQGLASTDYGNAYNRAMQDRTFGYGVQKDTQTIPFNQQMQLAGLGMQGNAINADLSKSLAGLLSANTIAGGQAAGAGTIGGNNALTGMLSQIFGGLQGNSTLQQILARATPQNTAAPATTA